MVERPQTPEARSASPARLEESAQAYFRASQVHEAAAKRFRQVTQMTTEHRVTTGSGRQVHQSAEVAAAVALLHHPRSARQAVVASLILGTPRGLE